MHHRIAIFLAAFLGSAFIALAADSAGDKSSLPSHFVWGSDIGGSIDMSGHDMSTINIDAYFGYRSRALSLLGIGAGLNIPVNNSRREFPVYAIARTSFSVRPQPVFGELRAGIVVNSHNERDTTTDLYLSPGIGFSLATGRTFSSYLIVGYIYNGFHTPASQATPSTPDSGDDLSNRIRGIHSAVVRLGISF